MNPYTFYERLMGWKASSLAKLERKSWRSWLFVAIAAFILEEAVRARLSDASTLAVVWLFRGVVWITREPMGIGGMALIVYVASLATLSWIETRPRRAAPVAAPTPLPENERRLVQDLRTVWNRHGMLAISQLHDILRDRVYELREREFWAELLNPIVDNLEARRKEFGEVLDPGKYSVEEVRNAFNQMYAAYIPAMKWVSLIETRKLVTPTERYDERLTVWRQNHRDMVNRLQDLDQDPEHRGTLRIYLNWIDEPAFRDFMTEAEWSPDWLALVRESKQRAAVRSAGEPASERNDTPAA